MKLVSYNIQYGIGMDGRFDPERIASCLEGADVIALQEVSRGFPKNGNADLVQHLADLFPDHFHTYGAGCDVLLGMSVENGRRVEHRFQFGNMILSRWPILSIRHFLLPRSRTIEHLNLQRSAVEAIIDAPGGLLRFYTVHLDHASADERLEQIQFLKDRVMNFALEGGSVSGEFEDSFPTVPQPEDFVLMGDFNMEPETAEYISMVGRRDPYHGRILRANQPVSVLERLGRHGPETHTWAKMTGEGRISMHLDHCFINTGLVPRLKDVWVDNEAMGSDHFPLWVEIA